MSAPPLKQVVVNEGVAIGRWPVVIHPLGMVIHLLPKNASTSIKKLIERHNPVYMPVEDTLGYTKYRRVAVVRNPYDRLVSCWADKVKNEVGHATWAKRFREPLDTYPGMCFEEFARRVCEQPDELSDRHYRSQASQLSVEGEMLPMELYKLEDQDCWHGMGLMKPPRKVHKSDRKHYKEYYSEELREMVGERYKLDLNTLGYRY